VQAGRRSKANGSIGRAIRLGMMNLAGLRPDRVDRACLGQAFKYGAVIAEDEAASPWGPLHSTFGLDPGQSAVSMSWGAHPRITYNHEAHDPPALLTSIAEDLATIANLDSPSARRPAGGTPGTTMSDPGGFMRERGRLVVMGAGHRLDTPASAGVSLGAMSSLRGGRSREGVRDESVCSGRSRGSRTHCTGSESREISYRVCGRSGGRDHFRLIDHLHSAARF
jgi:hypothetical protein